MTPDGISVIMGIRNCADTLPQAIESVLLQTYTDWELIMCDDASTDNTYSVADEYRRKYPDKIILIKNETNSYLAFSLNRCLEHASGKYIARMDGDDISMPDRFEKQVAYLKTHPNVDLVGTAMQRFNEEGLADITSVVEHPDKYSMHYCTPFNHATIMTYKRVYDELGGYTVAERTKRGQDYDLWFRFFAANYIGDNIPEPLYRVREDLSAIKRRTFKVRWNAFKTTRYGYKLLGYPKHWIIKPTVEMVVKSLTPFKAIELYRKYQKSKFGKDK